MVEEILREYINDDTVYVRVQRAMQHELLNGLGKSTNKDADIKMFPSYVRELPDGTEKGDYLALDLGGTNFRVLKVTLAWRKVDIINKIYPLSDEIMKTSGEKLFDHIAHCIADFLREFGLMGQRLLIGFTFSFPCLQESLAGGRLVKWTKGFSCEGVVGKDVVQLLHEAIARRGDLDVECAAILNDSVGCLMSCAFMDQNAYIGVILGTGTNASYMERLDRVELWDGDRDNPQQVVINTEWGAFGDNGCIDFVRTEVDKAIDQNSINPGKQIYEKMISGMYMGEIARRIIVQCAQQGILFNGQISREMATQYRFYTKYISEIEKDDPDDDTFANTEEILDEMEIDCSTEDCQIVHDICTAVSTRAACLAAAGIASLLNLVNKPDVTVAIDGSLFRFHPNFHEKMERKIQDLVQPGINFKLMLSEDGSGKGAALVAAVAYYASQRNQWSLGP